MILKDRKEAGEKLAEKLKELKNTQAIVYALPRGGVVLGDIIAEKLGLPLDLVITRKIGHQFDPEYAIGAVAEDGHKFCNEKEEREADPKWLAEEFKKEQKEARRRRTVYLNNRPLLPPKGKIAIMVDDGIATGLTMRLAIQEIKHEQPERIIVAVPIVPLLSATDIKKEADELITLEIDKNYLGAVGAYYTHFPQVEDEEVIKIMSKYLK